MKCIVFKNLAAAFFLLSSITLASCGSGESEPTDTDSTAASGTEVVESVRAEAVIAGTYPDTAVTGNATFDVVNGKVKLVLNISVPAKANKSVAVHIHEHAGCGDMGKEAHGHWNPTKVNHGKWGVPPFHSGDIGNVQLDAEGKGTTELETDLWTIGGDSTTNILNRSIIVHGGVDDFKTQPTGDAGNRVGCGIINKK
jgi:Cu-Zn family superoxide dismutase